MIRPKSRNVMIYLVSILILVVNLYSCSGSATDPPPGTPPPPPIQKFLDDFSTDTTGNYTLTDTWNSGGQFLYDGAGQRGWVLTGSQIALQIAQSIPAFTTSVFQVDFLPTSKYATGGQIIVRLKQDTNTYYELINNDGFGPGGINKVVSGVVVDNASFQSEYGQGNTYTIAISFSPDMTIVDAFGEVIFMNSDTSPILVSSFEIDTLQQDAYYDNITLTDTPFVRVVDPDAFHFQTGSSLFAQAVANNIPSGGGVRLYLDKGMAGQMVSPDMTSGPFMTTFTGAGKKEHSVQAFVFNSSGADMPGSFTEDRVDNVGIGDYYVGIGDSITVGEFDDIVTDNVSLDGRNSSMGYEPVLNDDLSFQLGYPNVVFNEGGSGDRSVDGLARLPGILSRHPDAQFYLILFGTNDANPINNVPSGVGLNPGDPGYAGSYKDNMQQMISLIFFNGKTPFLSKVPIVWSDCDVCPIYTNPNSEPINIRIQEYNQVIDELVSANGISVIPPDFYTHYFNNPGEIADGTHPNGVGYQSMAGLWATALTP